jgi:hypothetical protein
MSDLLVTIAEAPATNTEVLGVSAVEISFQFNLVLLFLLRCLNERHFFFTIDSKAVLHLIVLHYGLLYVGKSIPK